MYYMKNLVVREGGTEVTEKTVTLLKGAGYELVVYNGSTATMLLTIGNLAVYLPGSSVLDEGFMPFDSFTVSGTATDAWSWYVRN